MMVHIGDASCSPVFVVNPNPTNGPVNIWTPGNNEGDIVSGTLFDQQGNVLRTLDGSVNEISEAFTHAMHGRREGVYIMKLTQCDETSTYRILKK